MLLAHGSAINQESYGRGHIVVLSMLLLLLILVRRFTFLIPVSFQDFRSSASDLIILTTGVAADCTCEQKLLRRGVVAVGALRWERKVPCSQCGVKNNKLQLECLR